MNRPFTSQHFVRRALVWFAAFVFLPVLSAAATHPLFNLDSTTQSPFPSDRFTVADRHQNTGLRVNLPLPNCGTNPSDCADIALLNQLDGFNPQPRLSIPFDGAIDPATVSSKTVFLVQLPARFALGREFDGDDLHGFHANIIGINQIVWDPASLTLFAESDQHLNQHANYLLIVTTGIRDAEGHAIRRAHGLNDDDDDTRDRQSRRYRHALHRLLEDEVLRALVPGLDEDDIAAASLFTTESVTATLESILDQVSAAAPPTVSFNLGSGGEKTVFPLNTVTGLTWNVQALTVGPLVPTNLNGALAALQVFPGSIGTIAFGKFSAKQWKNAGVFIPAVPTRNEVPVQTTEDVYFNLFIPAGTRPTNGWPVAIFGHGFTDSKQGAPFAVASTFGHHGIATIAINVVGHGGGALGTFTVIPTSGSPTIIPDGGRGIDQDGNGAIDSTEGVSAVPPRAIISSRDGLRQTVADLMQLVRVIE